MTKELREIVKGDFLTLLRSRPEGIKKEELFSKIEEQYRRYVLAPPSWMQLYFLFNQLREEGKVKCRGRMWRLT